MYFLPNVKGMARRWEARFNQTASSVSPSPTCCASLFLVLRGIGYRVKEILKIHANLLKLLLPLILVLVLSSDCVGRLEGGVIQDEKTFDQTVELLLPQASDIIQDGDTLLPNWLPVFVIELPQINGVMLPRLGCQVAHIDLKGTPPIDSLAAAAKAMPDPKAKESGQDAWKNAMIKYLHSGLWIAPLVTGLICFVVGLITGRFRIQIRW